ncbi:hypothetical protein Gotur_026852 [Gossypium turneri]
MARIEEAVKKDLATTLREWEVMDTCLNADDMRLVGVAYEFLKAKATSSVGSFVAPNGLVMDKKLSCSSNRLSSLASISSSSFLSRRNVVLRRSRLPKISAAKELHFNKDGSAIKKLQLSDLVGVTLGPKGRNVVLESKYYC